MRGLAAYVAAAVLVTGPVVAENLNEVLAANLEARGGKDAIASVVTARITGKMTMGPGMEVPFTWEWKRPNKIRSEVIVQGMTGIQTFDGETGWMVMPFMGKPEPERMPPEDIDSIQEQADFEGPLVNWQEKGNQVELVGEASVEGTPALTLKVTLKSGDVTTIFLDAETFLEIKEEGRRVVRGQVIEFETAIGDYRKVGGLMLAHSMVSTAKSMPMSQTITFEKIEINADVDDSRFAMPKPKALDDTATE